MSTLVVHTFILLIYHFTKQKYKFYLGFSINFPVQYVQFSILSGPIELYSCDSQALKMLHLVPKSFCWNEGKSSCIVDFIIHIIWIISVIIIINLVDNENILLDASLVTLTYSFLLYFFSPNICTTKVV